MKKLGTKSMWIHLLQETARFRYHLSLTQVLRLDLGKEQVLRSPFAYYYIPVKTMDARVSPAAIHC